MADAFQHCADLVRERDKDRFLAALFASPERRPLLYALYAFDLELADVGRKVREPMAGEIRLQWWRDVLAGERDGEAAAAPVAAALLGTLGAVNVPRQALLSAIDARTTALYGAPFATEGDFVGYAEAAAGGVMRAALAVLGGGDEAALPRLLRRASLAVAGTEVLRGLPFDVAQGRSLLPQSLLERHAVEPAAMRQGHVTPGLCRALAEFRARLREAAHETMAQLPRAIPAAARPAFLHVGLVPLYLDRMERRAADPFRTPLEVPQWRRQWRLWRLARSLGRSLAVG
ncbi:MAG TPA: squalene/phytoene synthase family protein [Xanthobacteraceae bacterium]|nr:squalene/phytoene synthase family protein [Xanthobacteraceae bacterium]